MVVCAHRVRWTALTGAAAVCARPYARTQRRARTQARAYGAFRNRSLFYLCEGVVSPRIAGTLGARNLEAGVVSLIVMKLISVLKFRNRYFEITPLFSSTRQPDLSSSCWTPRCANSVLIVINLWLEQIEVAVLALAATPLTARPRHPCSSLERAKGSLKP